MRSGRLVIWVLLALSCGKPVVPDPCVSATPPPSASLYQLDIDLETSEGTQTCLARWRGHPVLVAMFYASCPGACPLTIQHVQSVFAGLSEPARENTRVILVSFDPARDAPAALQALVARHGIDVTRWTLARVPEDQARELSAVLGVAYRRQANGEFDHNVVFTVLDPDGTPVARTEGLGGSTAPLVEALAR